MPNKPRMPHRWDTKFGQFVNAYGAQALAQQIGVTPGSIYHWLSGAWMPNPRKAMQMVELSQGSKHPLTLADIFEHAQDVLAAQARGTAPATAKRKGNDDEADGS